MSKEKFILTLKVVAAICTAIVTTLLATGCAGLDVQCKDFSCKVVR